MLSTWTSVKFCPFPSIFHPPDLYDIFPSSPLNLHILLFLLLPSILYSTFNPNFPLLSSTFAILPSVPINISNSHCQSFHLPLSILPFPHLSDLIFTLILASICEKLISFQLYLPTGFLSFTTSKMFPFLHIFELAFVPLYFVRHHMYCKTCKPHMHNFLTYSSYFK